MAVAGTSNERQQSRLFARRRLCPCWGYVVSLRYRLVDKKVSRRETYVPPALEPDTRAHGAGTGLHVVGITIDQCELKCESNIVVHDLLTSAKALRGTLIADVAGFCLGLGDGVERVTPSFAVFYSLCGRQSLGEGRSGIVAQRRSCGTLGFASREFDSPCCRQGLEVAGLDIGDPAERRVA